MLGKSTLQEQSNLLKPLVEKSTINGTNISAIDRRELSKIVSFLPYIDLNEYVGI